MVVCALVSGVVIEIAPASRTKRSILLATLQAEHFRLLRPASSGRQRSHSRPTRPGSPEAVLRQRHRRWRTCGHIWAAPCRGRRRECGD